jgi:hypothetical protein
VTTFSLKTAAWRTTTASNDKSVIPSSKSFITGRVVFAVNRALDRADYAVPFNHLPCPRGGHFLSSPLRASRSASVCAPACCARNSTARRFASSAKSGYFSLTLITN